jgi:hypothetical protein
VKHLRSGSRLASLLVTEARDKTTERCDRETNAIVHATKTGARSPFGRAVVFVGRGHEATTRHHALEGNVTAFAVKLIAGMNEHLATFAELKIASGTYTPFARVDRVSLTDARRACGACPRRGRAERRRPRPRLRLLLVIASAGAVLSRSGRQEKPVPRDSDSDSDFRLGTSDSDSDVGNRSPKARQPETCSRRALLARIDAGDEGSASPASDDRHQHEHEPTLRTSSEPRRDREEGCRRRRPVTVPTVPSE